MMGSDIPRRNLVCIDVEGTNISDDGIFAERRKDSVFFRVAIITPDNPQGLGKSVKKSIVASAIITNSLELHEVDVYIAKCRASNMLTYSEVNRDLKIKNGPQSLLSDIYTGADLLYLRRTGAANISKKLSIGQIVAEYMLTFSQICTKFSIDNKIPIIFLTEDGKSSIHPPQKENKKSSFWTSPLRDAIAKINISQLEAHLEKRSLPYRAGWLNNYIENKNSHNGTEPKAKKPKTKKTIKPTTLMSIPKELHDELKNATKKQKANRQIDSDFDNACKGKRVKIVTNKILHDGERIYMTRIDAGKNTFTGFGATQHESVNSARKKFIQTSRSISIAEQTLQEMSYISDDLLSSLISLAKKYKTISEIFQNLQNDIEDHLKQQFEEQNSDKTTIFFLTDSQIEEIKNVFQAHGWE